MMISKRGLLGAFLLLVLAACGKREEEMPPVMPDPVLRSVSVSVSEVVVPTNGSVQVPFVVEEAWTYGSCSRAGKPPKPFP